MNIPYIRALTFAISFLILHSCRQPIEIGQNQVYVLADEFSQTECKVTPGCDCCSAELILLEGKKFALIDRCLGGDTYFSGKYSNSETQLTLNFFSKIVNEISDEDYNVTGYTGKIIELGAKTFDIKLCDGKIHLVNASDSAGWQHGSRHKPDIEKELLNELPNLMAWQELQRK